MATTKSARSSRRSGGHAPRKAGPRGPGGAYAAAIGGPTRDASFKRRVGCSEPRIFTPPKRELTRETSRGFECIDFAEQILEVELLPWQKALLIRALETNEDGTYRFKTVVLLVARQNGKSTLIRLSVRMYADGAPLSSSARRSRSTSPRSSGRARSRWPSDPRAQRAHRARRQDKREEGAPAQHRRALQGRGCIAPRRPRPFPATSCSSTSCASTRTGTRGARSRRRQWRAVSRRYGRRRTPVTFRRSCSGTCARSRTARSAGPTARTAWSSYRRSPRTPTTRLASSSGRPRRTARYGTATGGAKRTRRSATRSTNARSLARPRPTPSGYSEPRFSASS